MIRRRTIASLLAVGALGVGAIAAGCGDDDSGGGDVGELKVGVLVPLTGDLPTSAGRASKAADLAAAQVNAAAEAGDTGLSMTLVTEDTKTDPQAAQEAATKVIESDGVSAIAGPWGTPELIPTAENVTIPAGVPVVTPSATGPDLTDLDDDGLVFRTPPSDAIQGQLIAQIMGEALGADATVNTANRNDAYGTALVAAFTEAWEAGGGTVAKNVPYNPEATSLNSEAQQIASGNPDGWMIIDYTGTWAKMGPALVRTGNWDPPRPSPATACAARTCPATPAARHRGHARHGADLPRCPGGRAVRRPLEGGGQAAAPVLRRPELRRGHDPMRSPPPRRGRATRRPSPRTCRR